jgi:hypothetical protein
VQVTETCQDTGMQEDSLGWECVMNGNTMNAFKIFMLKFLEATTWQEAVGVWQLHSSQINDF